MYSLLTPSSFPSLAGPVLGFLQPTPPPTPSPLTPAFCVQVEVYSSLPRTLVLSQPSLVLGCLQPTPRHTAQLQPPEATASGYSRGYSRLPLRPATA